MGQLKRDGVVLLDKVIIGHEEYAMICQECADILRDELEPCDYHPMHPDETIEEFLSHEN